MLKILLLCTTTLLMLWQLPPAQAGTDTTTFGVSVTAVSGCEINTSTSELNFGEFIPGAGGVVSAAANFDITCTLDTPYAISISKGQHSTGHSGEALGRALSNGTNLLTYNLYTNSARTDIWKAVCSKPPGGTGTDCQYGTGSGTTATYTVYGKLVNNQSVPPGEYQDQVLITVNY